MTQYDLNSDPHKSALENAHQHLETGQVQEAHVLFSTLIKTDPTHIGARIGMGQCELKMGHFQQAKLCFETVLNTAPNHGEAHYGMGLIAQHMQNTKAAQSHFGHATNAAPPISGAFVRLAQILHQNGQTYDALKTLQKAEARIPDADEYKFMRGRLAMSTAQNWHIPMLADTQRNDQYDAAIKRIVKPGNIVLDIGTGSGILAMMAARAGAEHVYACESNPLLAQIARDIIAQNGYADKITLIAKQSNAIIIGTDMPEKADVLVTEIFDNALIGEGVLPTLRDAWARLLKPAARLIPQSATLYGALVACPSLKDSHQISRVNGFDLSAMNAISAPLSYTDMEARFEAMDDCEILSQAFTLNNYDFSAPPPLSMRSDIEAQIVKTGRADAVLMWFDLGLAPDITFSTKITRTSQHWRQVAQVLPESTALTKGQKVNVKAAYNRYFTFSLTA